MRRLLLVVSAAALMLVALPSAAVAQGSDVYGVGAGRIAFMGDVRLVKFEFSGHTGPQGDFGQFRIAVESSVAPLDVRADADCVRVFALLPFGGGGYISGPVKKVTDPQNMYPIEPGDHLIIGFNDFGEPSDPIRDEFASTRGAPEACRFPPQLMYSPIDQGNIVVKLG